MVAIPFEYEVRAPAERIFDTIVDLGGYDRWLDTAKSYPGITEVGDQPITEGSTYVERDPRGTRRGTVRELRRPTRVAFAATMTMKPRLLGVIDIETSYDLTPGADSVHVRRVTNINVHWPLKLVQPIVVRQFRREGERTIRALKAYAESGNEPSPDV